MTRRTEASVAPAIVVVDTETTGLGHVARPPRDDAIIQIGLAYRAREGMIKTWSEYCNPGPAFLRPGWADEALETNRITRAQVLASSPSAKVASNLRMKLETIQEEVRGPLQLRAYNRDFDQPFLAAAPWSIPPSVWGPCIMIETTRHLDGQDARWVGLNMAMLRLNLEWPGPAHRADTDAQAALLVLEAISQGQRNRPPSG